MPTNISENVVAAGVSATQTVQAAAPTMASVADKAVDKVSNFVDIAATKATNVFEAASNIITKGVELYGKDAVNAVLWVVRIDAIQHLVIAWVLTIITLSFFKWEWGGFMKREWHKKIIAWSYDGIVYLPLGICNVILILILYFNSSQVLNVWNYVAVAKPELYLAKQAVEVVKDKLNVPKGNDKQR